MEPGVLMIIIVVCLGVLFYVLMGNKKEKITKKAPADAPQEEKQLSAAERQVYYLKKIYLNVQFFFWIVILGLLGQAILFILEAR